MNLCLPRRSAAVVVLSCLASLNPVSAEDDPGWVQQSNAHTLYVLRQSARLNPESAARSGLDGVDEQIIDLGPGIAERRVALLEETLAELRRRLRETEDPRVRQDIEILIASQDLQLRQTRADDALILPYVNVPRLLFFSMNGLLDPALPRERQEAALVRLRRYAGLEAGYEPLTERAMALYAARAEDETLIGPYRGELERDLATSPQFMAGIGQLFAGLKIEGYQDALAVLDEQVGAYNEWVRTEVMPRARDDFRQPEALYALALEQWGVDATPRELIDDGLAAYMEIRNEMQALAPLVAAEKGWDLTDYRDVVRELKKDQFPYGTILERYQETNTALEAIIREQGIVSIPDRPLAIRLATEAESANIRQPHLRQPRFVGNTGELIEFLIPPLPQVPEGEPPPVSDFSFEAMRWTLSAHEARPGHELQFSAMLEGGVSDARGLFAFNSVNVEGWALYAEAEVKPYLPLDGQLIGLQGRLWRAARLFLDPMLNTGQISEEEARRVLLEGVVMTPASVDAELTRYTFQIPGQATAYLYGYKKLMELKAWTELTLGDRFDLRAYHDFILAQGLLPPALLAKAVREAFVPTQLQAAEG